TPARQSAPLRTASPGGVSPSSSQPSRIAIGGTRYVVEPIRPAVVRATAIPRSESRAPAVRSRGRPSSRSPRRGVRELAAERPGERQAHEHFTMDTTLAFSAELDAYFSCTPTGPFVAKTTLYSTPETGPYGSYGNP